MEDGTQPGVVETTFNHSTWKEEAGGSLSVPHHPGLYSKTLAQKKTKKQLRVEERGKVV